MKQFAYTLIFALLAQAAWAQRLTEAYAGGGIPFYNTASNGWGAGQYSSQAGLRTSLGHRFFCGIEAGYASIVEEQLRQRLGNTVAYDFDVFSAKLALGSRHWLGQKRLCIMPELLGGWARMDYMFTYPPIPVNSFRLGTEQGFSLAVGARLQYRLCPWLSLATHARLTHLFFTPPRPLTVDCSGYAMHAPLYYEAGLGLSFALGKKE